MNYSKPNFKSNFCGSLVQITELGTDYGKIGIIVGEDDIWTGWFWVFVNGKKLC